MARTGKRYVIHRNLISARYADSKSYSSAIEKLQIEMIAWDEDDVARLIEWLYTGDYISPVPSCGFPGDACTCITAQDLAYGGYDEAYDMKSHDGTLKDIGIASQLTSPPLVPLEDLRYPQGSRDRLTGAEVYQAWLRRNASMPDNCKHYGPTMLCHARLYALAHVLRLDGLKALAFRRLQEILISIKSFSKSSVFATNLNALLEYIYESRDQSSEGSKDPIRNLVTTFVAMHPDEVDYNWKNIDIVKDVLAKVQRINASTKKEIEELKSKQKQEHDSKAFVQKYHDQAQSMRSVRVSSNSSFGQPNSSMFGPRSLFGGKSPFHTRTFVPACGESSDET